MPGPSDRQPDQGQPQPQQQQPPQLVTQPTDNTIQQSPQQAPRLPADGNSPVTPTTTTPPVTPTTTNNTRRKKQHLDLPPAIQAKVDTELPKRLAFYDVKEPRDGIYKLRLGITPARTGRAKMGYKTYQGIETTCRQLWTFFALIGDYDSMLMLLHPKDDTTLRTFNLPTFRLESICQFIRYKGCDKTTYLTKMEDLEEDQEKQTDVLGRDILCTHEWNAPRNFNNFVMNVNYLLYVHRHNTQYKKRCELCYQARERNPNAKHCEHHQNITNEKDARYFYNRGNPVTTPEFKDNRKIASDPTYIPLVASHINPSEFRKMRRHLLGANQISGLKQYVMSLLGIRLFLRSDEIVSIKMSQFITNLHCVKQGQFHHAVLKISGKSDKGRWHYFRIPWDEDDADLCALTHLLIYIHLARIKSQDSYLFPPDDDLHAALENPQAFNGCYTQHDPYHKFLAATKRTASAVLPYYNEETHGSGTFRISTHIFRKAAYLFRILALHGDNLIQSHIMELLYRDARHTDAKNAEPYVKDCLAEKQARKHIVDPDLRVSFYQSVWIDPRTRGNTWLQMAFEGDYRGLATIDIIANDFVQLLGLPPGSTMNQIIDKAISSPFRSWNKKSDIVKKFTDTFNRKQAQLWHRLEQFRAQERRDLIDKHREEIRYLVQFALKEHGLNHTAAAVENIITMSHTGSALTTTGGATATTGTGSTATRGTGTTAATTANSNRHTHTSATNSNRAGTTAALTNLMGHDSPHVQPPPSKKRKRNYGLEDMAIRIGFKDFPKEKKLAVCKQLIQQYPNKQPTTAVTQGAGQFWDRTVRPSTYCLENHFGGNDQLFLAKVGGNCWSRFPCCKKGIDSVCFFFGRNS